MKTYPKIKIMASANAMKGSLSAQLTSKAMIKGAKEAIAFFESNQNKKFEKTEFIVKPIADGGDDTLDVLADTIYEEEVMNPLGKTIKAKWGSFGETAIIEMAKASGIALIKPEELNPFITTTYGTGQLIHSAIEKGFKKILITIGGSATVDGGIGALSALGAKFYDEEGNEIETKGNIALGKAKKADFSAFERYKNIEFLIACDVDNKLLGENGSAAVFGPQKLSPKVREDPEQLKQSVSLMDKNMENFSNVIKEATGVDTSQIIGSGAAGGFVIGFVASLNATLKPGSEFILNMLDVDSHKDANIIFTSEGMCDRSTLNNKAPFALTKRMKGSHIVILTGAIQNEEVEKELYKAGASLVLPIEDKTMTLDESMKNTETLIRRAAFRATYSYLCSHY